ncbi:hypothetical protein ACFUMH_11975 [Cellulomonas sp. NPDC057328]|uniref:hypothetical protein n=1 Tax=Cellulomonas sp. NPDC057328 TaxID=3346101 RepID=UPI00362EC201
MLSFDLAFWYDESTPSPDDAYAIYDKLTEGEIGVVAADEAVSRFLDDVRTAFADLTDENAETSPWASPIYATDECVIVAISGSRSADVVPSLLRIASDHGLVTYDPQNDEVLR